MPTFKFSIETKSVGLGYVNADTLEEAKEKIANEEWDDIYDEVNVTFGELIDIKGEE